MSVCISCNHRTWERNPDGKKQHNAHGFLPKTGAQHWCMICWEEIVRIERPNLLIDMTSLCIEARLEEVRLYPNRILRKKKRGGWREREKREAIRTGALAPILRPSFEPFEQIVPVLELVEGEPEPPRPIPTHDYGINRVDNSIRDIPNWIIAYHVGTTEGTVRNAIPNLIRDLWRFAPLMKQCMEKGKRWTSAEKRLYAIRRDKRHRAYEKSHPQ